MKTRWIIAAIASIALAILAVSGAPALLRERSAPKAGGTNPAACDANAKAANLSFTMKDMYGKDVKLSGFKGNVILLDFWATWCAPCKYEIPGFVELYARYKDKGLVVLGLSVDDPVHLLKPFAAQYRMNYPVLVGLDREDVQDAYGPIWGIPTTFLISRDGRICKKHTGIATKEQFEREIKGLL